jgi:hypothetical protein
VGPLGIAATMPHSGVSWLRHASRRREIRVHPELFELKALVAGRLDPFRRREIDDHLSGCADCSRHYVAMMLGSASPKTAEAEARQVLVPTGGGAGGSGGAPAYGIDAPIAPSVARAPTPRAPHSNALALETVFTPAHAPVPVSASLVDAITRIRSESEAQQAAEAEAKVQAAAAAKAKAEQDAATAKLEQDAKVKLEQDAVKAKAEQNAKIAADARALADSRARAAAEAAERETPSRSALIEPSIFMPTPLGGFSLVPEPKAPPVAPLVSPVRSEPTVAPKPAFSLAPAATAAVAKPAQELTVTFTSTPTSRVSSHRSPAATAAVSASANTEYVSMAVPTLASVPHSEFSFAEATPAVNRGPQMKMGMIAGGVALAVMLSISGYKYFRSSVSEAAAAAATAAAAQVQATARNAASTVAAPVAAAPVQTRIVYVQRPSDRKSDDSKQERESSTTAPVVPLAVSLPDVNVSTGQTDASLQTNSSGSATSELTRTARATASRTLGPRP